MRFVLASPLVVMGTDPARAPTAGVDNEYRRQPGDPIRSNAGQGS